MLLTSVLNNSSVKVYMQMTPSGVLCSGQQFLAWERYRAVGLRPQEGHEDDQSARTSTFEDSLRELELFILEKRRHWENLQSSWRVIYFKGL